MPKKKITFETVRQMALTLPDVEQGTSYGSPALKVRGRMFACIPTHRSAEPDSLAIVIDFDHRDALIATEPDTYYLKDHYVNYPVVLVRLAHVDRTTLRELLRTAWRFSSSMKPPARSQKRPRRRN